MKFPVMISEEEISFSAVNSLQPTGTSGHGKCVLLAEDDKALRRYLEVVLERSGYLVESAADGLEAMKLLLSKKIDLVITDAVMPNLTGYELCRFIRSTRQLSHLPIVLLSALDPRNAVAESEQADAFLGKPVSPEDLLQTLSEVMSREKVMSNESRKSDE
jgi:twitching motility two-component system response regulator PilH